MMRLLVALLLVFGLSGMARAETIAATGSTATVSAYSAGGFIRATPLEACQAFWDAGYRYGATVFCGASTGYCRAGTNATDCPTSNWANYSGTYVCPTSPTIARAQTYACPTYYNCPSTGGWTLSGTSCTRPDCAAGTVRETDGSCVSACGTDGAVWNGLNCACPGIQSYDVGPKTCGCETGGRLKGTSITGTGTIPATTCYSNCTATVGGLSVSSGGVWAAELGSFSGAKCATASPNTKTPTTDTRTPAEKCLASGGGYITTSSGTICTSLSDSPQPITTSKVSDVVNKDATGAVTGTTTTSTECVGTQCTTTTTTKDATGAVVSSTTTTGTSADTGEGGGGGDGDSDECTLHPERVGCAELGTPEGTDELQTVTRGVESITQQSFAASSACPSDIPLPKGSALSFSYPCQLATSLRPLLLALAWLAAGLMVMGVFRDG